MWFADIYCDLGWVRERDGILGPPRLTIRGARSKSLGLDIEFQLFGDDLMIRHVRVLLRTEDQRTAEACVDLNIQTWVASLEVAVMLVTNKPFQVMSLPNSQTFAIGFGQGDEQSPALLVELTASSVAPVNYRELSLAMSAWGGDLSQYLFYFRRLVALLHGVLRRRTRSW
jgi:hypothetical protein